MAEPTPPRTVVVRLADGQESLAEAIRAQLVSLPVELVIERGPLPRDLTVSARLTQALALGAQHTALLVYWVEPEADNEWLLYAVDPREERLLVRPIDLDEVGRYGAVDVVAVIARDATEALLHGGRVELGAHTAEVTRPPPAPPPVEPPPAPATTPAPRPANEPPPSKVWLSVGYRGQHVAPELPWDSGIALQAAWMTPWGGLLGLEYFWLPPTRVAPSTSAWNPGVQFELERVPVSLWIGQRLELAPLSLEVTLAATLELSRRAPVYAPAGFESLDAKAGQRFALCPGIRLSWPAEGELGLFAAVDVAVYLKNFGYSIYFPDEGSAGRKEPLLTPRVFSPRASIGGWAAF